MLEAPNGGCLELPQRREARAACETGTSAMIQAGRHAATAGVRGGGFSGRVEAPPCAASSRLRPHKRPVPREGLSPHRPRKSRRHNARYGTMAPAAVLAVPARAMPRSSWPCGQAGREARRRSCCLGLYVQVGSYRNF